MDIYLVRHTLTDTEPGLCYGQTDVALSANFAEEVLQVLKKLPPPMPDTVVFSSPLSRCRQLAEKFSSHVITDDRLLEINFGDWENTFFNEIDPIVLKQWSDHFVTQSPPNGENFTDLFRRAGSFWHELLTYRKEQIVIVTHAGVIRALLVSILEMPLANAFHFRVEPGSVHKFQAIDNYVYIDYVNR